MVGVLLSAMKFVNDRIASLSANSDQWLIASTQVAGRQGAQILDVAGTQSNSSGDVVSRLRTLRQGHFYGLPHQMRFLGVQGIVKRFITVPAAA
jgi:hypothetical protein